jgi:hypothetical protein
MPRTESWLATMGGQTVCRVPSVRSGRFDTSFEGTEPQTKMLHALMTSARVAELELAPWTKDFDLVCKADFVLDVGQSPLGLDEHAWGQVYIVANRIHMLIPHPRVHLAAGPTTKRHLITMTQGWLRRWGQVVRGEVPVIDVLGLVCCKCGGVGVKAMDRWGLGWCREHMGDTVGVVEKYEQGGLGI